MKNASIIIPCYNSAKYLDKLLSALRKQTVKPNEIIIVDDGSTDNTKEVIGGFSGMNIKYFWKKNAGPAKARNFGAKKSKGELLLFVDSDCVPENDWLEEMIKPFSDKKVGGVQGRYKTLQKEIIARFVQIEIEERYELMQKAMKEKTLDWIGSYSAAYRAKAYNALGGFDESFPMASGEDPELSYRLQKSGYRIVFNENAVVYHTHPNKLMKYLKTKFFRAYFRPKMYSAHKEKILKDSYTPQGLKVQIGCVGAISGLLALLVLTIAFGQLNIVQNQIQLLSIGIFVFLLLHVVLGIKIFIIGLRKDPIVALISPILILLRSIAFTAGLIAGVVRG